MATERTLAEYLRKLFQDVKADDLTVFCGDRIWKCHQIILCPRCPFFDAACNRDFKEPKTFTVDQKDNPPEGVDVMLEYLYTLAEPDFDNLVNLSYERAEGAFILGDKYNLNAPKAFDHAKMSNNISSFIWTWRWQPNTISDAIEGVFINRITRL